MLAQGSTHTLKLTICGYSQSHLWTGNQPVEIELRLLELNLVSKVDVHYPWFNQSGPKSRKKHNMFFLDRAPVSVPKLTSFWSVSWNCVMFMTHFYDTLGSHIYDTLKVCRKTTSPRLVNIERTTKDSSARILFPKHRIYLNCWQKHEKRFSFKNVP